MFFSLAAFLFTGSILQDFAFSTYDNTVIETKNHQATVVVFTTTDCPIARSQQPTLTKIYKTFQPQNVGFVAIQINPELEINELQTYVSEYKTPFPQVIDAKHKWVKQFRATVTPQVFVLNSSGQIAYQGAIDNSYPEIGIKKTPTEHYLQDAIVAVLAKKSPKPEKTQAIGCIIPSLDDFE